MKQVAEILLGSAERFAASEAVADPRGSLTYEGLTASASQLARGMARLGLRPGERSMVVLPNSVGFIQAHFANLLCGAISVPCDSGITAASLGYLAESCAPRMLLTDSKTFRRLTADHTLPAVFKHVLLLDAEPDLGPTSALSAQSLAGGESPAPFLVRRERSDVAAIMYTTGTTGKAKGVVLTNENVMAALRSIAKYVGYTPDDREVVILPLSHNFGLGHVYCNLMCGGAVYTEPGLVRVGRVLTALEQFRATGFPGTPMGFGMLMDQYAPILAAKGRNLRFTVINSAPMPPERTAQLRALLPQLNILIYYGLTEASRSTFISLTRMGPSYYRSVGRPMPHVEVTIQNSTGKLLPAGDAGEVVIRGPAVSQGYWNNPGEEEGVFRDGWLHTGDLGVLDTDGFLWINGRLKDVINVGGYKVNPGEVEKILLLAEGIIDAAVCGVEGDPRIPGEAVVAGVVLRGGITLDEAALQQHCLSHLEKFKVPVRFLAMKAIPRTDTGKIKRAELVVAIRDQLTRGV